MANDPRRDREGADSGNAGGGAEDDEDWATEDSYRLLSIPFLVRSTDASIGEGLRGRLAPFRVTQRDPDPVQVKVLVRSDEAGAARPKYSYLRDGALRLKSASRSRLVDYGAWDIHACVPKKSRDSLLLHAGGVNRADDSILVPGPPNVGKSSLVTALLSRGFDYLSDELGVIDPDTSRAHPFPKLISLAPDALETIPGLRGLLEGRGRPTAGVTELLIGPQDLGAVVGAPGVVRSLVFPSFDRAGSPRLIRLSRSEAVRRMAELSFNLYRFGERGVVLLSRIADHATSFALEGGSIRERADLLADRFV